MNWGAASAAATTPMLSTNAYSMFLDAFLSRIVFLLDGTVGPSAAIAPNDVGQARAGLFTGLATVPSRPGVR